MNIVKSLLITAVLVISAFAQTAAVTSHNTTTIPYNGIAVPVHLAWGAVVPPTGWIVADYCIGGSSVSGQEHLTTTIGSIVYKGCGTHATGTSFDLFPGLGPHFWVVWAELLSTDGT